MIYLLRHTKPAVKEGICYGVTDLELDSTSCEQDIKCAVETLQGLEFEAIYSSPLKRCMTLAKAASGGAEIIVDPRLKELDFGDWEMTPWSDIFNQAEGKKWFDNYIEISTPNGESFRELISRAESFIADIKSLKGDILLVTHAGFIRAAMVALGKVSAYEVFDMDIKYGALATQSLLPEGGD